IEIIMEYFKGRMPSRTRPKQKNIQRNRTVEERIMTFLGGSNTEIDRLPVSLSASVSGIWVKHRVTKTDSEIGSDRR
ncbi:unnamed protein product, partial [marine sediment metagenome]